MRIILISIILSLFYVIPARLQTLEDLKKLEQLKKQFEQNENNLEKADKMIEPSSLTTFKDSLAQFPEQDKQDFELSKQVGEDLDYREEPKGLTVFGHDIFWLVNVFWCYLFDHEKLVNRNVLCFHLIFNAIPKISLLEKFF